MWPGYTIVCLASGPSLTQEDVNFVQRWRDGGDNRAVIVVNTTYQMAPWADALFAMDYAWWAAHISSVREIFKGAKFTVNNVGKTFGEVKTVPKPFSAFGNSGAGAIKLASLSKPPKIVLLGYDLQHTDGKRHWHGNHPKGLGNADSVGKWAGQFSKLQASIQNIDIVNCSRKSALTAFRRGLLEEELCSQTLTHPQARCLRKSFV